MRKTQQQQSDETALMERLEALDSDDREHLLSVVALLVHCYGDPPEASAVLMLKRDEHMAISTFNADDMQAVEMVQKAHEIMGEVLTIDAPPKDMFN